MNKAHLIIKLLKSKQLDAWVCGGTARDLYLGIIPVSWDIAVAADLVTLKNLFTDKILNINEYSANLHVRYMENEYILYPLKKIELVNTYYNYSFTSSLEEDSNTRDFTINALYYDPLINKWFDFHNGIDDLNKKIIRFVGDPFSRILESKIRLLRAPILKARLGNGWVIEEMSKKAIQDNAFRSMVINTKQVNKQLIDLLTKVKNPSIAFYEMLSLNLLDDFFPELKKCVHIVQPNKQNNIDLFKHIMLALDASKLLSNDIILPLAVLLHDIGKPYTQTIINGELHFYNHEVAGAYLSENILQRWGFNRHVSDAIHSLVYHHLFNLNYNNKYCKKLIQKVGPDLIHTLIDLRICDRAGGGKKTSLYDVYKFRDQINKHLNAANFKLNITDEELSKECNIPITDLQEIKEYLILNILENRLQNKNAKLKQAIQKLNLINCPLDKNHLYLTWSNISKDTADIFPSGLLKCGVFCNFICNKLIT